MLVVCKECRGVVESNQVCDRCLNCGSSLIKEMIIKEMVEAEKYAKVEDD